jgi:hypothetical protein
MLRRIKNIPWALPIVGTLTLGLAPFVPQPHLVEKFAMLAAGTLNRPLDIFDLALHAAFPLLLLLKVAASIRERGRQPGI